MANEKENKRRELKMSDASKQKYAELFIARLDSMEAAKFTTPWVSPLNGRPCNLYRRNRPYTKSNAFFLSLLCETNGYNTPFFLTKNQMKNEELRYKGLSANSTLMLGEDGTPDFDDKGQPKMVYEHRFPVVFYKPYYKDKDGNKITEEEYRELTPEEQDGCRVFWGLTWYLVYNIDQTNFAELYPEDYAEMTRTPEHDYKQGVKDDVLEAMIMNGKWRCPILLGGNSSHYNPVEDHIRLPERSHFLGDERFYAAAIHEMAHSTAKELKRKSSMLFGSETYALEEFVAELSSACVCSILSIGKLLDENHIAYVQGWRKALREDKDVVPRVIDQVQLATNYILGRYEQVRKELYPLALPQAA